jgi:hypothetical protein
MDRHDITVSSELLKYYYSECINHSIFILSLAIGFFSSLNLFNSSFSFPQILPTTTLMLLGRMYFACVFSTFIVGEVYFVLRLTWWGFLAGSILYSKSEDLPLTADFKSLHRAFSQIAMKSARDARRYEVRGGYWLSHHILVLFLIWLILFLCVLFFPIIFQS